ncbi:MAG TPA: type 1 glutamine amidotransferase [bacterium]|nr:type 1 glutamine amidotransferase [bacterium]
MKKIGISACFFHADPARPIFKGKTLLYLEQSIAQWVMAQGALAYLIPAPAHGSAVTLRELAEPLDGLVLQGGSDVAPESYGETPLKPEWAGDAVRDRYEMALVTEFRAQGKPVLGICRGVQLVNVALGGTLYQDIASQVPGSRPHRDWEAYDQHFHALGLEGGLRQLNGNRAESRVNSVHHQGLKDLGTDLVVEARSSEDGLVEAVRASSGPYLVAVQWHPEFQDPADASLFDGRLLLKEFLSHA